MAKNLEDLIRETAKLGLAEVAVRVSRYGPKLEKPEQYQAIAKHRDATRAWGVGVCADPIDALTEALTKFPEVSKDRTMLPPGSPAFLPEDTPDAKHRVAEIKQPAAKKKAPAKKAKPAPAPEPEEDDFDGMFD